MQTKQNILLSVICVFLLLSCSNDEKTNTITNGYLYTWTSINSIHPFEGTLIIKEDSTFEYRDRIGFSFGSWKTDSLFIVLNSFKTDSCLYISFFKDKCFLPPQNEEELLRIREKSIRTTVKGCEPTTHMTNYRVFQNDSFYLQSDTLIYNLSDKNLCSYLRDTFIHLDSSFIDSIND